nr:hypothetical protein [Cressdnaviricota sp.]
MVHFLTGVKRTREEAELADDYIEDEPQWEIDEDRVATAGTLALRGDVVMDRGNGIGVNVPEEVPSFPAPAEPAPPVERSETTGYADQVKRMTYRGYVIEYSDNLEMVNKMAEIDRRKGAVEQALYDLERHGLIPNWRFNA